MFQSAHYISLYFNNMQTNINISVVSPCTMPESPVFKTKQIISLLSLHLDSVPGKENAEKEKEAQ